MFLELEWALCCGVGGFKIRDIMDEIPHIWESCRPQNPRELAKPSRTLSKREADTEFSIDHISSIRTRLRTPLLRTPFPRLLSQVAGSVPLLLENYNYLSSKWHRGQSRDSKENTKVKTSAGVLYFGHFLRDPREPRQLKP